MAEKKTESRRRRGSSIGDMSHVGTASLNLSSTISKDQKHNRLRRINKAVKSNKDLLHKFFASYLELSLRMTWLTPLVILIFTYGCYGLSNNYTPSNPLHMFVSVSYNTGERDATGYFLYDKGVKDFAFIGFHIVFFTFLREFTMSVLVRPVSKMLNIPKGKLKRFNEQMYVMVYCGFSSPFGIWVMTRLPIGWFNTYYFYAEYPHKAIFLWMKVFYLGQAAFWSQQALVLALQLEKPRKDYYEFVFHHIVTMCLIYASYTFNFTWIGIAIYICMDVSDWFLAMSKTLNYIDSVIQVPFFAVFIGVWLYFRHYICLKILYSVFTEFKTVGPYVLNYKTGQYKCFISQPIVFLLLVALQLVNLYWCFLIFRILFRFLFQGIAKDDRSDDEDEEDEDGEDYDGFSTDSEGDKKQK